MEKLKIILVIAVFLLALDQLFLWMERKNWVYYRHNKPTGSAVGNAMQEFNALLNPSARHVIQVKQQDARQRDDQGDDKDLLNKIEINL